MQKAVLLILNEEDLPLNTETPNFVALFVFKGVPSFILRISSETKAKQGFIFSWLSEQGE